MSAKNNAAHEVASAPSICAIPTRCRKGLLGEVRGLNADPTYTEIGTDAIAPPDRSRAKSRRNQSAQSGWSTPTNIGRLAIGEYDDAHGLIACTPSGR